MKRERPAMEEILEPGLAWMVMATEEGVRERIQVGNLFEFGEGGGSGWLVLAFPFFVGAINTHLC